MAAPQSWTHIDRNRQIIARAVARAWREESYRERLLANPRDVLTEEGAEVPDGLDIAFHEDTESRHNLVLPERPRGMHEQDLEDEAFIRLCRCVCYTFGMD